MEIIGAIGGLLGAVFGLPAIILFFLNRKNANKKVEIEEGGLNVSTFDAQTRAYQDLLDRANEALTGANSKLAESVKELAQYKEEREELIRQVAKMAGEISDLKKADAHKGDELVETNNKLERLRTLMLAYIKRTGIPLTPEEQIIFDDTIPADIVRKIQQNANDLSSLD